MFTEQEVGISGKNALTVRRSVFTPTTYKSVVGLSIVFLFIIIALMTSPNNAQAQTNLVSNGNFSSGTAGWNWHNLSGTENCCSNPPNGYPNAYAHPNGAGGSGVWGYIVPWQNIPNPQAGTYTLSGRIRTSGGAQQVWIQADNGNFFSRYCKTPTTNTASWTSFSCQFTLSSPATIHVALAASNAPATAWGWVVWDDISLTRSGGTQTYDLAQYMMRTNGTNGPVYKLVSPNGTEKSQIQYSGGKYFQVKNQNWEEFSYDNNYIRRYRDTSPNATQWYGLYEGGVLGSKWSPRYMKKGDSYSRNPLVKFYNQSTCNLDAQYYDPSTIKLIEHWDILTINGHQINDVILLKSYRPNGAEWEHYYYARNIGLVKFVEPNIPFTSEYDGPSSGAGPRMTICNP